MKDSCPSGAFRVSHCLIYKVQTAHRRNYFSLPGLPSFVKHFFKLFLPANPAYFGLYSALSFAQRPQQTGHKKDSRLDCHPYVSALPIFPGRRQPSIFGASELNCRVRNGYGWTLGTSFHAGVEASDPQFAFEW